MKREDDVPATGPTRHRDEGQTGQTEIEGDKGKSMVSREGGRVANRLIHFDLKFARVACHWPAPRVFPF
jgi:hypothetical protein